MGQRIIVFVWIILALTLDAEADATRLQCIDSTGKRPILMLDVDVILKSVEQKNWGGGVVHVEIRNDWVKWESKHLNSSGTDVYVLDRYTGELEENGQMTSFTCNELKRRF